MTLTKSSRAQWTSALASSLLAAFLFGLIVLSHSLYVSLFASNYPFWDQWAQLHNELVPWWTGRRNLSLLFAPHNEHRILFTRLLSMLWLWLNHGHWGNLVEAYANTLVWGGVLTLLLLFLIRDVKATSMRLLLFLCIVGMGCLPFDWENTLVGFQNQFYFMVAAAMLLSACAAWAADTPQRSALMLFLAVASLFTMASGLLAPLVGVAVLGMRGLPDRTWSRRTLLTTAGLFVVALAGLVILPNVPKDVPLHAQGLVEHARGMLLVLTWPLEIRHRSSIGFLLLLWLPVCLGLVRLRSRTKITGSEMFLLGLAGWVVLQAFAIAHARGHDMTGVPSRYTDIVVVGVLANVALAILWASRREESRPLRRTSAAWLLLMLPLLGWIMIQRMPDDVASMANRGMYSQIETANISRFLTSGDKSSLKRPGLEIGFPSASTLTQFLLEPDVRSMVAPTDAKLTRLSETFRHRMRTFAAWSGIGLSPQGFQPLTGPLIAPEKSGRQAMCTVDAVNAIKPATSITMHPGEVFTIQGWIIWPKGIASSDDAVMTLSDHARYQIDLHMAANRPDVVKALHSAPALTRGFSVAAPIGLVAPGTYNVAIAKALSSGTATYCRLPFALLIKP